MTAPRTILETLRADEQGLKADLAVCSLALLGSGARGEATATGRTACGGGCREGQ